MENDLFFKWLGILLPTSAIIVSLIVFFYNKNKDRDTNFKELRKQWEKEHEDKLHKQEEEYKKFLATKELIDVQAHRINALEKELKWDNERSLGLVVHDLKEIKECLDNIKSILRKLE